MQRCAGYEIFASASSTTVMRGLDPRIHLANAMDGRVTSLRDGRP